MKQVVLIRHAESAEKVTGQTDKSRELTTFGIRQATNLGLIFNERKFRFDGIYSSTAQRTRQTCELIAERINIDTSAIEWVDDLYQGPFNTYLEIIGGSGSQTMMIVGHNPTITYVAEFLSGEPISGMAPAEAIVFGIRPTVDTPLTRGCATLVERILG